MLRDYSFQVDEPALSDLISVGRWDEAYELLATPIHEWLFKMQSFDFLSSRTVAEQLVLSFDYVQMQVGQGGFIQLIQNGYISLLVTVVESIQTLGLPSDMAQVLDDALKVFVLNKDVLGRETSVEEFGRLYGEFQEFDVLEKRFNEVRPGLIRDIIGYIAGGN